MMDCISRGSIKFEVTRLTVGWITRGLEDPRDLVKNEGWL